MSKGNKLAAGILAIVIWVVLGTAIGAGVGYFAYVKKPAFFESTADVQIIRTSQDSNDDGIVDDSALIVSDSVIASAIASRRLNDVPEIRDHNGMRYREPEQAIQALTGEGGLTAHRVATASHGGVYRVHFIGKTPSSAAQVVTAMIEECKQSLPRSGDHALWKESVELLGTSRRDVTQRIRELESQLSALPHLHSAVILDDELVSATAERARRLRQQADLLQIELTSIDSSLRHVEKMIQEGASAESILVSLGAPRTIRTIPAQPKSVGESDAGSDAAQRKQQRAARETLEREVERDLKPLQKEMDKLLETLGSEHPTVRGVRTKMEQVRARLGDEPPIDPLPVVETPPAVNPPTVDVDPQEQQQQITRMVAALRAEKTDVAGELKNVTTSLEAAVWEQTEQQMTLRDRERIESEIGQQQAFAEQIISRLDQVSTDTPPVAEIGLNVLHAANPGVQIAPDLIDHLARGGIWGAGAGAALAILLLLTTFASGNRRASSE